MSNQERNVDNQADVIRKKTSSIVIQAEDAAYWDGKV